MSLLVGWEQKRDPHPDPTVQERLGRCEAFDVAYEHLFALLPDCPNCSCL